MAKIKPQKVNVELRVKRREPASPAQIQRAASVIAAELLAFSADEGDRIMAAVATINSDSDALEYFVGRIVERRDCDGCPESDDV